ncbi:MAG: endolytic transglycosylase MltG [Oscillospiraceae bacterium]
MDNNEKNTSLDDILESIPEEKTEGTPSETEQPADGDMNGEVRENNEDVSADNDENAGEAEPDDDVELDERDEDDEEDDDDEDDEDEEDEDEEDEDEEDEEERPKARRKKRRKRGPGRLIFGLIMTLLVIGSAILLSAYIIKYAKDFLGIGKSSLEIVVEIPMNSSTEDIAQILYDNGVISNTYLFRFYSRVKGSDGTFVAGEHTLALNMTYEDMVEELQKGAVEERESVDIVFPEGITLYEAAQKLEEKGVCGADEFIRAFNTADYGYDFEKLVKVSALKFYKMEGYLFPDTYTFYLDEDPKIAAKRFCKNFNTKVTADIYGRMDDLGMELEEVLTLASMVQAEAQNTRDMKLVASVFLNRLDNPDEYPLLQSDPTKKYVTDIIMPNIEVPSKAMYAAYNTYEGAGLPPGPICNPGLDAINAVLYPSDTNYYYFCANVDTGEIFYAETLAEHEENLVLAGIS